MVETWIILLHGDITFNSKEREYIQQAIDAWYQFTKGRFLFHIEYDFDQANLDMMLKEDLLYKVNSKFHHIQNFNREKDTKVWGLCRHRYPDQCFLYLVADQLNISNFKNTTIHELGHCLGLEHTDKPSIMHGQGFDVDHFNELDALELQRWYGFELSELDYD